MKNSSSSSSSGGLGFIGALTIVFIVLKLLHKIEWSWIWVLSPIWISTALVIILFIAGLGIFLLVRAIQRSRKRARNNKVNKEQ